MVFTDYHYSPLPNWVHRSSFLGMRPASDLHLGFAVALRQRRIQCGLSQEFLAYEAGVDRTYVSQLERGLKAPSLATVDVLAHALDMRPSELVEAAEEQFLRLYPHVTQGLLVADGDGPSQNEYQAP